MAKAPALSRGQAGVGKVLPVDRADKSLDRLEPVVRHVIERNYGSERLARLSIVKKRQLRTARRRAYVNADLVMPARGQRDAGGAALPRAQLGRSLDKVDDPGVDLRRPIDALFYGGLVRPSCETANPSACAARASP